MAELALHCPLLSPPGPRQATAEVACGPRKRPEAAAWPVKLVETNAGMLGRGGRSGSRDPISSAALGDSASNRAAAQSRLPSDAEQVRRRGRGTSGMGLVGPWACNFGRGNSFGPSIQKCLLLSQCCLSWRLATSLAETPRG